MLVLPAIRLATSDDAHAIAALSRDCIEHGLPWRYTPARIQETIRSRSTNVAVIHTHGGLHAVGIMGYGDAAAHLVLLGVQPTQRRKGLGRHLVAWLEASASTAGLDYVGVECRADMPGAVAFYRAQGYRIQGVVARYYGGRLDAVRLRKRLSHLHATGGAAD
ncbi:MAG TPA: N-acetyltransferase [Lysobacter sp.]|jgi:ribosomal-protein-alanine N-acetyltransferase|nr:N-acetyltransferase [Lysobacter sp.]